MGMENAEGGIKRDLGNYIGKNINGVAGEKSEGALGEYFFCRG